MDYEYWLRLGLKGVNFYYLNTILAGSRLHAATKTLSARKQAHKETNDMLKEILGQVPDRWLSNYAHVIVRSQDKYNNPNNYRKMQRALAVHALFAGLRWNKKINKSLLKLTLSWFRGSLRKT